MRRPGSPGDSDSGSGHEEPAARSTHSRPGASVPGLMRKLSPVGIVWTTSPQFGSIGGGRWWLLGR